MNVLLCALAFASGFSALVFETLWFRQAGLAFGNSVWASSLVLSGFMSGLALGNALAARYGERLGNAVRAYAAAEIAIALTGVGLVHLLPAIGPLLAPWVRPLLDHPWVLNAVRLALAFLLLLVPSTAMGVTLPLLTKAMAASGAGFGAVLGQLYGWNTLGAMAGVASTEMYLLAALGVRGTALAAGALSLAAALAAGWLSTASTVPTGATPQASLASSTPSAGSNRRRPARDRQARPVGSGGPWLAAAFVSGFCLLALEVVWFRLLLLVVMGHSTAFALMLAIVLAGIALGGLAASLGLRAAPEAHRFAAAVAFAAALSCVLSYRAFPDVIQPFETQLIERPGEILRVGLPLMLPVSLLSGVFFTLAGSGVRASRASDSNATGVLTLANTAGAALGALTGGFVLLPAIGMERAIACLAALYGVGGLMLARRAGPSQAVTAVTYVAGAGCVAALAFFPFGAMQTRLLQHPVSVFASPLGARRGGDATVARVAAVREGLTETILYLDMAVLGRSLFDVMLTNAVSMADTEFFSRRYMKLYVYWPMAVHPGPRRALLICYGVGNTAKAMTDTKELETIDIVDISRDVLDMSAVVFPSDADNPLRDPRVRTHVEDGRYFLQTTDRRFDLITAEPPPPASAGTVNLYTREYFQLLRDRLAEGGIAAYWLPLHALSDVSARAILGAFCGVFEDCSLWHGSGPELMMIGTRGATGPVPEARFLRQWSDPSVAVEMKRLGVDRPEQLGALFIGDAEYLRALVGTERPLTDDDPKRIEAVAQSDAGFTRLMGSIRDTTAARERFRQSGFIARLWPDTLRQASLPYFDLQHAINVYMFGGQPAIEMLHAILTASPVTTPALWLFGSNWDVQRLVTEASPAELAEPAMQFQLGVRLLAERSYAAAAGAFGRAERQPDLRADAFGYRIYALCMAGQVAEAQRLVRERDARAAGERPAAGRPSNGAPSPFWRWMRDTFEIVTDAG